MHPTCALHVPLVDLQSSVVGITGADQNAVAVDATYTTDCCSHRQCWSCRPIAFTAEAFWIEGFAHGRISEDVQHLPAKEAEALRMTIVGQDDSLRRDRALGSLQ
ncbi:hypothetical protein D3C76_1444130 [compost metagenome]